MNKNIYIYGAGGLGVEILSYLERDNEYNVIGFLSDVVNGEIGKYRILGDYKHLANMTEQVNIVIAIGDGAVREIVYHNLISVNKNIVFPNLIFSKDVFIRDEDMGRGNVVCPGSIISTNSLIDSFNLFNINCTVGHDADIGRFNSVAPGCNISGNVRFGDRNYIGTNACIVENICIPSDVLVVSGSVLNKDILLNKCKYINGKILSNGQY